MGEVKASGEVGETGVKREKRDTYPAENLCLEWKHLMSGKDCVLCLLLKHSETICKPQKIGCTSPDTQRKVSAWSVAMSLAGRRGHGKIVLMLVHTVLNILQYSIKLLNIKWCWVLEHGDVHQQEVHKLLNCLFLFLGLLNERNF